MNFITIKKRIVGLYILLLKQQNTLSRSYLYIQFMVNYNKNSTSM